MIKDKNTFLKKLALQPELKGNRLSIILALNSTIYVSKREQFVDNIKPFWNSVSEEDRSKIELQNIETPSTLDNWLGKDLRIDNVRLKSVRGFPATEIPFGINFLNDEGIPQSMILLGANGAGKSSIYNAIEYAYCRKIGEAQLRTAKNLEAEDDFFKQYLSHFNQPFNNAFCEIKTVANKLTFKNDEGSIPEEVRDRINPDSHFISDFDIYEHGQLNYESGSTKSFHNLIAESLGLKELLAFEKNLKVFLNYNRRTESNKINSLKQSIAEEQELIETNKKTLSEKKKSLQKLESTQEKELSDRQNRNLLKHLEELKSRQFTFQFDVDAFLKNIRGFNEAYARFSALEAKHDILSNLQFLQTGLNLLQSADNCPFCDSSTKSLAEIKEQVSDKINQIESLNEVSQTLNRFKRLIEANLHDLLNSLALFQDRLQLGYLSNKDFGEFPSLLSLEHDMRSTILKERSEEFYRNQPKEDFNDAEALFKFLETNGDYINQKLEKFIAALQHFGTERDKQLLLIEEDLASRIGDKSLIEQLALAKKEIENIERQIQNSEQNITRNEKELIYYREQKETFDKIKREAQTYTHYFHLLLSREVTQAYEPIKEIVEDILKSYLEREGREVELKIEMKPDEIDQETGEVLSEIITASIIKKGLEDSFMPVNKYFNTFHYRLFATMVGISIAIASRINTKINLPLVLDDIFYASDFKNRGTVERFIKSLFELFEKYTVELPLQLILFTHDELIFESALKATAQSQVENIAFAKLFPHTEAQLQEDYKELAYQIPAYLPFQIMRNTLIEAEV